MKILVVKHFNQLRDLHGLDEKTLDQADLLLICYSACSDQDYDEHKSQFTYEKDATRAVHTLQCLREEFINFANVDQIICERAVDYDLIIKLDSAEMSVRADYVDVVLKAMSDDQIGSCFCDFNIRKESGSIYTPHLSVPSPVQAYPLFAVRTSMFNGTTTNLIGDVIGSTRTKHILDVLVDVYE
jgi:hypothetical protein